MGRSELTVKAATREKIGGEDENQEVEMGHVHA